MNFNNGPLGLIQVPFAQPVYASRSASGYRIDSAAKGVAFLFCAAVSEKLTDVYVYITAAAGTAPTLSLTLAAATGNTTLGSDVANYSTTATGRSSTGWVKFTFSNGSRAALVAGTNYFLKVSSNGDASNYNDVCNSFNWHDLAYYSNWAGYTTTNTFSSISVVSRNSVPLCLTYETVSQGNPYTSSSTGSSNTNYKGMRIGSLPVPIKVTGFMCSSIASVSHVESWRVGNGSAEASIACGANLVNQVLTDPITLAAGVDYRLVMRYSSSQARPGYLTIDDPNDYPAILACRFGGDWHYCEYNGSSWTDYPKQAIAASLIISSMQSSGGTSRPYHPLLSPAVIG